MFIFSLKKDNYKPTQVKLASNFHSVSGNYLAGYYAYKTNDIVEASNYFNRALSLSPNDPNIIEVNYLVKLLNGEVEQALSLLRQADADSAAIIKAVSYIKTNKFQEAISLLESLSNDSKSYIDRGISPLLISWSYLGLNKHEEAIKSLDNIDRKSPSYGLLEQENLVTLTKALIYDLTKDNVLAEANYTKIRSNNLSYMTSILLGNFYERNDKAGLAKDLYQKYNDQNPLQQLFKKKLEQKNTNITAPIIANSKSGITFLFSQLSNILAELKVYPYSLIYANLGYYLEENDFTKISLANYYLDRKDFDKAKLLLGTIGKESPFYLQAQTNFAICCYKNKDFDQGDAIFKKLNEYDYYIEPSIIYADLLRENLQYLEAIKIYDNLIKKYSNDSSWYLYYLRSLNYNLLNDIAKAEQDLLKALELNPGQPSVMNDLAYSWLLENKNLVQASQMIAKALAISPESPAIMDSMGWVLYLKGNYEEALQYLQKANEIMPDDYTINDHLGDVYWKIGNKIIAKYQWNYALNNCKDDKEINRIKLKLVD